MWVLAGVAGVAALGFFLWQRKKAGEGTDTEDTPSTDKCETLRLAGASAEVVAACKALAGGGSLADKCEALRLTGASDAAVGACKAGVQIGKDIIEVGDAVLDAIITGQKTDIDAVNIPLNGAIVASDPLNVKAFFDLQQHIAYRFSGYGQSPHDYRTLKYIPPQYANGCIPIAGLALSRDVGRHKCVEGTVTYTKISQAAERKKTITGSYATPRALLDGFSASWPFEGPDDLVDQDYGDYLKKNGWRLAIPDPFTHPHYYVGNFDHKDKTQPFPLEVPPGSRAWWVCGQPYVAPGSNLIPKVIWAGGSTTRKTIQEVRWIEVGSVPEKVPPPVMQPTPPGGPPDGGPPVSDPPREFIWVPTPAPGHWERPRKAVTTP